MSKFYFLLIFTALISCQKQDSNQQIEQHADSIFQELVEIRRDIHENPELSGEEQRTAQIVSDYLNDLGIEVHENIAGHGVVGILNPNKKGKVIAWRADMDAIPNNNTDLNSFKSQVDSVGHMCGHDVHTAIGLGIAYTLSQFKDQLDGPVYFVFQPKEETFTGAKEMMNSKKVQLGTIDEIYGAHIFPTSLGSISTKPNELFAYEKTIELVMSSNISKESFKKELEEVTKSLQRSNSKHLPANLEVIVDEQLGVTSQNSIYQDFFYSVPGIGVAETRNEVSFSITFFETNRTKLSSILNHYQRFIETSDYQDQFISIEYSRGNPTVINDPELTTELMDTFKDENGNAIIKPLYGQIPYFNEDFIYYQEKIPGVLFFLGASNALKDIYAMPHSDNFQVDEEVIKYGVTQFSKLIMQRSTTN